MNSKEIREKFGDLIDLENMKLNPGDMKQISKIGQNLKNLVGKEEIFEYSERNWSSDGKYIRKFHEVFKFLMIKGKLGIHHIVNYSDDDGTSGGYENTITGGREILNTIKKLIKRGNETAKMLTDD